ncbi:hypothetical protein J6590_023384 [Homalodisca vitripennis]|nr:hypothetical protein J6590_023384 [Homalodisca vitripennis]
MISAGVAVACCSKYRSARLSAAAPSACGTNSPYHPGSRRPVAHIAYLKATLPPSTEEEFFVFLRHLNVKDVIVYAIEEGSVAFPKVPLMRVEGPLIIVQLLETTLLTLVNYASLMATNAARYRMVAGKNVSLLEFGLRRAQGPDGGLSASKYSYVGKLHT